MDEHEKAYHSYTGSNGPRPFCWPLIKVEGISLINLQIFQGEWPALELERTQLMASGGGRLRPLHHLILDLFEHEKARGLMAENSNWLEVSDPDDPPSQLEEESWEVSPPASKRRRVQRA